MKKLIIVLLLWPLQLLAQGYVINGFDAELDLKADGNMIVTETITVTFNEPRRGIFRFIPVDYDNGKGSTRRILFKFLGATDPGGQKITALVTSEGENAKVRLGDKDIELPPGTKKTYVIRYSVFGMMNWFDNTADWTPYSELYWNVTGDMWDTGIEWSRVRVRFPTAASGKGLRMRVFTGAYGSTAQDTLSQVKSGVIGKATQTKLSLTEGAATVERTAPFEAYEGLTLVLNMPSGLIKKPSLAQTAQLILLPNLGFGIPVIVLLGMLVFWLRFGKDPYGGPMVVQYDPPDDLSGPESGAMIDEQVDLRDLSAGIVALAVKGCLDFQIEEKTWVFGSSSTKLLIKPRPPGVHLDPFETRLYELLNTAGPEVTNSELQKYVAPHVSDLRNRLYSSLVSRGYYQASPQSVRAGWLAGGIAIIIGLGFLFTAISPFKQPLPAIIGGGIGILILGLFSSGMPKRTSKGAKAHALVRGFEEFIKRAKGDELNWMAEKHPDMALFEKYLPHALAFGLAEQWSAAFADILKEPPNWYHSPYPFNYYSFGGHLSQVTKSVATAASTPPRSAGGSGGSSGFSSGGGFSGGGFGGGGGGSW